jgi:pimeloyl-ACP methyl ester carboxylesterase
MIEKSLKSFDNTEIVYQVGGKGDRWLMVANGYGGTFCAWREIFDRLKDHYRLLVWDYRGMHRSEVPRDRNLLKIVDHCRDIDRLCEAENIDSMVLAGWSVGVQVALEQYRQNPASVSSLILINGSPDRVLQRSAPRPLSKYLLPLTIKSLNRISPVVGPAALPLLRNAAAPLRLAKLLSILGVVQGYPSAWKESLRAVLDLDYEIYTTMGLYADEHEIEDFLPQIDVPTLITGGGRDMITPAKIMKSVAAAIPNSQYLDFERGTHYSVMEFPQRYAEEIHRFIRSNHP